jgi:hypothetical protein
MRLASILCCIVLALLTWLPYVSAGRHNHAPLQPDQLAASAGADRRLMSRTELFVLKKKLELKLLKEKLQQKIAVRGGAETGAPAPVPVDVSARIQSFVIVHSLHLSCLQPAEVAAYHNLGGPPRKDKEEVGD